MEVAICLPSHGGAHRPFERCLSALRHERPTWQIAEYAGCPCVDIARAAIAMGVLKDGKADVLLWLDADMTFSVETCETVAREALERDAIVGCLYSGKKFQSTPQVAFLPETREVRCFGEGSILEVSAIGFGVVAHPRSMLMRIVESLKMTTTSIGEMPFYPWWTTDPAWESFHSDDYAFCRRARLAGFRVFADTRQRVGHCGNHIFHLEDAAVELPRAETFRFRCDNDLPPGYVGPKETI